MHSEGLLFIGGWDFPVNHRAKHMAAYLEQHFEHSDLVAFEPYYSGPPTASRWYKARSGISNSLRRRIRISARGSVREITIRDLYAPDPLHWLVDDFWRYCVLRRVITSPYDVVVLSGPHNAWLIWLLKRSGRVKCFIYDDHDYHPGWQRSKFRVQLVEHRELLCVRHADSVISTNALLARLRRQQGARDVLVVPNGVDLSLFTPARRKIPHVPTLVYMGALSPLWGLDLAIQAMPRLLDAIPDVRLSIAGRGPAEADLKALSRELGVAENVNFLGCLEYDALPGLLAGADVGIATSRLDSEFRKYATPLKLIEYMAAGLPVIASSVGQTEATMRQANAGVLIGDSVAEFVAAATRLLTDRSFYEHCSQAAITYVAGFDWNLLLDQVYQYVLHIAAGDQA